MRHGILGIAGRRPGSEHLGAGIGERSDDGDAPRRRVERQQPAIIGKEHDRAAGDLPRQSPPVGVMSGVGRRGRSAAVGGGEEAETFLQRQHPAHGRVDLVHGDEPAVERRRKPPPIDAAHHVDVDARTESERCRLGRGFGNPMGEELRDGIVVADENAIEPETLAQPAPQKRLVRRSLARRPGR